MRPLSVYDISGGGRRGRRTSRPRSCRRRERPTDAATPASASVRLSSVSDGTVESFARTIQRPAVSRPWSSTSRASSGSSRKPRRKPVAQITCSAPFGTSSTRKRPSRSAWTSRLVPRGPGRERRRRQLAELRRALLVAQRVVGGEAALREERARHVQRPPERFAAPDRDDLGTRGQRVQPLGRSRHPRADDRDAGRVLVRLVGMDGVRIVGRPREARVPGRDEDVRERARHHRARTRRRSTLMRSTRCCGEAAAPAGALAHLLGVGEKRVDARGDTGSRRWRRAAGASRCAATP